RASLAHRCIARRQRGVLDLGGGQLVLVGEGVEVTTERGGAILVGEGGQGPPPYNAALGRGGTDELDHVADPAHEGGVHIGAPVGGEDRQTVEAFQQLQQVVGVGVGVTVVRVLDL